MRFSFLAVVSLALVPSVGCYVEDTNDNRAEPGTTDDDLEDSSAESGASDTAETMDEETGVGETLGTAGDHCTVDSECADDNPCTLDVCDGGECMQVPASDVQAGEQNPNDCRVIVCMGGEPHEEPAPNDLPDDANDCTIDTCDGDTAVHTPEPLGDVCGDGGACDGNGACVECLSPSDCEHLPPDDDCRMRTCEAGVCGQTFAPEGTPANATLQTTGDCRAVVCDGEGNTTTENAPSDVPVDGLECTEDVCVGGQPDNPPVAAGTSCAAGECNAIGQCTGCNEPSDCGDSTPCQAPTCSPQGVCGVANQPEGWPVANGQTDGDCQELRCDGDGAIASFADDADLPDDDGAACTDDICSGGLPQHPDLDVGSPCGANGQVCDGAGVCVQCVEAADCPAPSECDIAVCNDNVCGTEPAPVDTACDDGLFCTENDACNGAGTCIGSGDPCDGADGDDDCSEACDETANACSGVDPDGGACDDGLACTADDACVAGTCTGDAVGCTEPQVCDEECGGCCDP
jgi:hypothetical protein